jgi:hypothetical protein
MTGKRKREENGERDSALPTSEQESPKRRATASISNSPSVREPKAAPEDGPLTNEMPPTKRRYVFNVFCYLFVAVQNRIVDFIRTSFRSRIKAVR